MVDFREYANRIKEIYQIEKETFYEDFICFLVDNEWFQITPSWQNGHLLIEPNDFQLHLPAIERYFTFDGMGTADKYTELITLLRAKLSDTADKLKLFYQTFDFPEEIEYYLTSFILKFLNKDLCLLQDEDIQDFLSVAFEELSKQYGDILTFFLSWLKEHYKTYYMNDYSMTKRKESVNYNTAYDTDEYLELLYYLFNEEYILENDMYVKAAQSKNYVDTWLFLSLHFICALRNSDIVRIHHPRLTMSPEDVINQVIDGTFPDEECKTYGLFHHMEINSHAFDTE